MLNFLKLDFSKPGTPEFRRSVRMVALYVSASVVIAILTAVSMEFFVEWARELGAYDRPTERAGKIMTFVLSALTNGWVDCGAGGPGRIDGWPLARCPYAPRIFLRPDNPN